MENHTEHSPLILTAAMTAAVAFVLLAPGASLADGWDPTSQASNLGSIVNTRHNLSLPFLPSASRRAMDTSRNGYDEICVYCHTPHGANSTISAPLWNRTNLGNTYTLYNIPLTSGQAPTQPGVSSLTCLSCHDGTVAIDSIVNMPGSGRYSAAQQTSQDNAFLSTWTNASGQLTTGHRTLKAWASGDTSSCLTCHSKDGLIDLIPFDAFALGTDLTNDHPVGVQLPNTTIYDFNAPTATNASLKFYDTNGNSRADSNEIRFYNTGEGYEVECASCHDPHGVPSGGPGTNTLLRPSFLRVSNAGSAVCLTCHNK